MKFYEPNTGTEFNDILDAAEYYCCSCIGKSCDGCLNNPDYPFSDKWLTECPIEAAYLMGFQVKGEDNISILNIKFCIEKLQAILKAMQYTLKGKKIH